MIDFPRSTIHLTVLPACYYIPLDSTRAFRGHSQTEKHLQQRDKGDKRWEISLRDSGRCGVEAGRAV